MKELFDKILAGLDLEIDEIDLPAGGLHKGEGLPIGKRDKSSCSLLSDREHLQSGRERQGCRKPVFRYACAGFRKLFSRKTVSHAPHGWRFGECAGGKGYKKTGSPVDCPQDKWKLLVGIQSIKQHFVTETVTCQFPACHR